MFPRRWPASSKSMAKSTCSEAATLSRRFCGTTWSTGSTYGSTRYFSAPARDSSVKGPFPRVSALLALRRSPKARFTWRTSMPGSPSTATCRSKAERTSAVPKAFPREYQVDDENHLQSRDTDETSQVLPLRSILVVFYRDAFYSGIVSDVPG